MNRHFIYDRATFYISKIWIDIRGIRVTKQVCSSALQNNQGGPRDFEREIIGVEKESWTTGCRRVTCISSSGSLRAECLSVRPTPPPRQKLRLWG